MMPSPTAPNPALDPDAVLAGPRGRRLCLELADIAATAASMDPNRNDFHSTMFEASHAMEPDRDRSSAYFGPGAGAGAGAGADVGPPPNATAAQVAALLDAVPLPDPTVDELLEALTATVNSARYWQEPDGRDVLAATPEMRQALSRFAQLLADSPHTQWWTAPMDAAAQWSVGFVDDPPRVPAEVKGAAETLEQWRLDLIVEEFDSAAERPADPTANWGGTWWSRPPSSLPTGTRAMEDRGPVGLWLVEDGFGQEEAVAERLEAPGSLRIYEIDSPEAWANLCREHSLDVTASKRHDWYRTTGRNGPWVMPDWARLQGKYDGVHLTLAGYLATAGVAIPVDDGRATVLAGWDPDATFWFHDIAGEAASRQTWAQVQDRPAWSLQASGPRSLTAPARSSWSFGNGDHRGSSETALLGTGEALWQRVCADVLCWKVKTRSGFTVDTPGPVAEGQRVNVTASLFGVKVVEPVEVVAVVDEPDRVGFSYRTLPGHPVSGEEAFIVHRFGDEVHLTVRSLTKAAPQQPWRSLFPLLMVVQKVVRRRYLRALL